MGPKILLFGKQIKIMRIFSRCKKLIHSGVQYNTKNDFNRVMSELFAKQQNFRPV